MFLLKSERNNFHGAATINCLLCYKN